jgi:hypothetical protein
MRLLLWVLVLVALVACTPMLVLADEGPPGQLQGTAIAAFSDTPDVAPFLPLQAVAPAESPPPREIDLSDFQIGIFDFKLCAYKSLTSGDYLAAGFALEWISLAPDRGIWLDVGKGTNGRGYYGLSTELRQLREWTDGVIERAGVYYSDNTWGLSLTAPLELDLSF